MKILLTRILLFLALRLKSECTKGCLKCSANEECLLCDYNIFYFA